MEEDVAAPLVLDGSVCDISFGLASSKEICTSCANDIPIVHPVQLTNPFLGLPLESGKCEACGTTEHGQCEGHFGYIQLPIDVYHPCHVLELKHILNLVCLKCLRLKKGKVKRKVEGKTPSNFCLCRDLPPISVNETKTIDGALGLELKVPSKARLRDGFWDFLERYGYRYGDGYVRPLLPCEALNILKQIPADTRKKLASKGCHLQNGFIMQCLPVPPNCLYSPDYTDGKSIMSSDISLSLLKGVLNKAESIKRSRSGSPNFESYEIESNDLQAAISLYMRLRGTPKAPHDVTRKFVRMEGSEVSTKQWLEKMRTLFIRKSSGFSSRSVITGDTYKGVNEIGLPLEIAMKITVEEKVTAHNMRCLQEIVDNRQCVTYRDGSFTYAITVGSKGHTSLKVGQVIHRRIMDGDVVFVNRPPSTHKHSLQAFSVYVHEDRTVKLNPLICAPLGADFDGDCVHIFYPQSLAAKAEALELFSVDKQLLSSHTGTLNLQLPQDSLLALKLMHRSCFLKKTTAQQLAMFACASLPPPAVYRALDAGPLWTDMQILQSALPRLLDCFGSTYLIRHGEIMLLDFERDLLQSTVSEIVTSILFLKGQKEALMFFNLLQPLLMEFLFLEGFSISLMDFNIPKDDRDNIRRSIEDILPFLHQLRETYNELIDSQVENDLKKVKIPAVNFVLKCSSLGYIIDSKSDSTISKVVQQLGLLGLQLSDRGKLYSPALVNDIFSHFTSKYPVEVVDCPAKAYGLIGNSFFHGLDPYEVLVHSISTREVIIRSSGGLTEPGTLFKNLMSILRDVVVCYDGTIRNVCTNSIVLFEYGAEDGKSTSSNYLPPGEPVGVLAATAISNPAYKAVLDSSQSTNSSWELMKEALLCKVNFKNDAAGRRVILYMNDCFCGKWFCKEKAAYAVHSCMKKVTLRDCAVDFSIEYHSKSSEMVNGLMGHIHLSQLDGLNCKIDEICKRCQDVIGSHEKKRNNFFKKIKVTLGSSECCSWDPRNPCHQISQSPCLHFSYHDPNCDPCVDDMEGRIDIMVNMICPILLDTVIKGDPRVHSTKIVWISPDTIPRVGNPNKATKGEVAVEVVIEKDVVKQNGDAWRVALDSCLHVMHLIDTRRSIPYGIQQIQDYLGISSAFDQSIQRLSTAVRSVSKGVLKQHLMLVVHCMTCSGNVIGFNTSGFKALFRSLKVQVPFTEATLFTPLKCFERAAEKCHRDSLASVVAACSWGKRVATGTGTHFQIMWNEKQMADLQDVGKDVYSFLQLVRGTSSERGKGTAYLGVDVDSLGEVGNADLNSSPEHNLDLANLTFDEGPEAYCNLEDRFNLQSGKLGKSSWDNVVASTVQSDDWQQWGNEKRVKSNNQNDMSATSDEWQQWGNEKRLKSNNQNDMSVTSDDWQQWGNEKQLKSDNQNDMSVTSGKSNDWQQWGNEKQLKLANQNDVSVSHAGKSDTWQQWGNRTDMPVTHASKSDGWQQWDDQKQIESRNQSGMPATPAGKLGGWQGWGGAKETEANDHLGVPVASAAESDCWQRWSGKQPDITNHSNMTPASTGKSDSWGWNTRNEKQNDADNYSGMPASSNFKSHDQQAWKNERQHYAKSRNDALTPKHDVWSSWDAGRRQSQDNQSSIKVHDQSDAWQNRNSDDVDLRRDQASMSNNGKSWNAKPHSDRQRSPSWGSKNSKQENQNESIPISSKSEFQDSQNSDAEMTKWSINATSGNKSTTSDWNKSETQNECGSSQKYNANSPAWGTKSNTSDWNKSETQNEWGSSQKYKANSPAWGTNSNQNMESTAVNSDHTPFSRSDVLASQTSNEASTRKSSDIGWNNKPQNRGDRPTKSHGWSSWNSSDRRTHRKYSDEHNGQNAIGGMTSTGRRLDFFSCEEEKILFDVEPVMQSIKRILHQSSYSDGGRLSAEDQSYILENVFRYHPDRNAKVGGEVDYVMVDKHTNFPDTRCFFVVSTDGSSSDFSYIKCMENFIKETYPENAESFSRKYFRRRRVDAQNESGQQAQNESRQQAQNESGQQGEQPQNENGQQM